jgi:NTP pyrophosphatase (non-canonical NTP hydrolase)
VTATERVFELIRDERRRQDEKWGSANVLQNGSRELRLAVLTEEVGEVAKAILDHDHREMLEELIQVAAVAVAWLEKP